jgi:hypothetical protein
MSSHSPVPNAGSRLRKGRLGAVLPWAVFVGALILFLSTFSVHYSEGEDSAEWVYIVTYGPVPGLFSPHHIGFLGLSRVVYDVCRWFSYTGDAGFPMKVMNALAGAFTLSLMVKVLRRLRVDDLLILIWVSVTAASFGFWSYSTQPETYMLSMPAILIGVNILIGLADDRFSPWSLGVLGGLMAFATLMNQMHVILILSTAATVVLIWYRRRPEISAGRLLLGLASFGGVAALIIGGAYFGAPILVFGMGDLDSIIRWSKGYASDVLSTPFSVTDPIKSLVGIARTVLGGHFLSGFDWFHGPMTRVFPGKLMVEERYMAGGLSPGIRITCLVASIVAAFSGVAILISLVHPGRWGVSEHYEQVERRRFFALDAFASLMLIVYYVFNVIWEPTNDEFWIGPLPIACLAVAAVFARRPPASRTWVAGVLFAVSLFVANGMGSILPQTRLDTDYWYQANRYLIENARKGDVVVTDGGFISDHYLKIYTRANVVPVHAIQPDQLSRLLSDEQAGRVWLSSWASEPPREVLATGQLKKRDEAAIHSALAKVSGRLIKRGENTWQTVWELER